MERTTRSGRRGGPLAATWRLLPVVLALATGPTAALAEPTEYRGMCDASAAVAIDGERFAVADDESNLLWIYRRGQAMPVAMQDLSDWLGNVRPSGKSAEADLEGAARIGTRIYWISSHARKGGNGKEDAYRQRLFATDIQPGAGTGRPLLQPVGKAPYTGLLDAIRAEPRLALLKEATEKGPEADGGFNIEGLAAGPDGSLLIGLRNPLQPGTGKALLLPLRNPQAVVEEGAAPQFGELLALDLGGRGIRSIDRAEDGHLHIAAGPTGDAQQWPAAAGPAFALFTWNGDPHTAPTPQDIRLPPDFRAEALFFDSGRREWVLLSDDGDRMEDGRRCKKAPRRERRFRQSVATQ